MRILVVGAGRVGAKVLRQLQKNPEFTVITADPRENPYAVKQGIIAQVDIHETLNPLNLDYIMQRVQPDLVLLTRTTADLGLGEPYGMDRFAGSLQEELAAISDVPMIEVARSI
jgi:nucleoside-diphosphate-sugar epimerase